MFPAAPQPTHVLRRRLFAIAILSVLCSPTARADFTLADFNGGGFDWRWGGFNDTPGASSVHLLDTEDGWGGAGFNVNNLDFSSLADEYLVIDLIPQATNGVSQFDIEFIETTSGGQTTKSGKWTFDVSGLTPGVPASLVASTPLSSPGSGLGDFQNLDLSQIESWQVLGEFNSPGPFDIRFDNIGVTGEAPPPYPGAEPDAAWRSLAASRIEANRKADFTVNVVDASGAVVPNATVSAAMLQHEFGFGSAVQGYRLRDNNPQYDQYKSKVAELFNVATLENNLKWPPWEGEWGGQWTQQGALNALDWLAGQGIDARGHVMVWPGYNNLPADIKQMLDFGGGLSTAEQQTVRNRIAARIAELGVATDGKLVAWDVINETRTNNDLMSELSEGDQAMVTWFAQAAAAAAGTELYINDFGILSSGGGTATANQNHYFSEIQYLKDQGAEIDGIGFQGHFRPGDISGPEQLWTILDRFETLGLKMQITEFDFETTDEALQAQYTRDFLTAMFAHEGVSDVILWGFWEGAHWRPDAAMYRNDWSIKPNGQAFLDLVFGQWWTDESIDADTQGEALLRGFKGDYTLTASAAGLTTEVEATLSDEGAVVQIMLPYLVGDYNGDGVVDAADYTVWRDAYATQNLVADGDNNGVVDMDDYLLWSNRYGASLPQSSALSTPEPATCGLLACACLLLMRRPGAVQYR